MTCKEIKEFLDKDYGGDISIKSRVSELVDYRIAYYFLANKYATENAGYTKIGKAVSRTHAMVYVGLKTFQDHYDTDPKYKIFINRLTHDLKKKISKTTIKRYENIDKKGITYLNRKVKNLTIVNKELAAKNKSILKKVHLIEITLKTKMNVLSEILSA